MIVCAHGNVTDFCKDHDMDICDTWHGKISDYNGTCRVLVTDSDVSENEYYFLKSELLARGIELISTKHKDDARLSEYLVYANSRRRSNYRGRQPFDDRAAIDRIMELRAAGLTLRAIREDAGVRRKDGGKLSISTIMNIIERESKNYGK